MTPHLTKNRWNRLSEFERWACVLWAIVLIASLVRLSVSPIKHSVYPNFSIAADRWITGTDLYAAARSYDFRYSPLVAVGFVPLSPLGNRIGGLVWCLLNTAVLLAGTHWWLKRGAPVQLTSSARGVVLILMLPLAVGNIASNQCNALIIGMLLIGMTAVQTGRFTLAVVMIVASFLFKIYPLSLGILLVVLYPRKIGPRLLLLILLGLLLPYLFQRTSYVATTYRQWANYLSTEDRSTAGAGRAYRDVQFLLADIFVPISLRTYRIVELAVAAVTGISVLVARSKNWPAARLHFHALILALCWMTAFGPATESMTYLLIAPVLCYLLVISPTSRTNPAGYLYLLSYLMMLYAPIAGIFPNHSILRSPRLKSIQPLAVLIMLATTVFESFILPARADVEHPTK